MIAFSAPLLLKLLLLATPAVLGPAVYTTGMACRSSWLSHQLLLLKLLSAWVSVVLVAAAGFSLSWYLTSWPLAVLTVITEYAAMLAAVALVSRRRKACAGI